MKTNQLHAGVRIYPRLLTFSPCAAFAVALLSAWLTPGICNAADAKPETTTNQIEGVKLSPQDRIMFVIKEDPAPASTRGIPTSVGAAGDAEFPISADPASKSTITLAVSGKTLAEVKELLKKKLEEDYYVKATITLEVSDRGKKPGEAMIYGDGMGRTVFIPLPSDEKVTLFSAVMKANPSEWARLSAVKLMRVDKVTKKSVTTEHDIAAMKKGDLSKDIELMDGDQIEIKEKSIFIR